MLEDFKKFALRRSERIFTFGKLPLGNRPSAHSFPGTRQTPCLQASRRLSATPREHFLAGCRCALNGEGAHLQC